MNTGKTESESPDVVSYNMEDGNKSLPRLPREYYQGDAFKQTNRGAGRHRAVGFVARQSKIHKGYKGYSPSSRLA